MVEDASADSSPLLQPNHRLDSVFSGGGSLAENRLGYVAVCENARRPAFVPLDRRAETTRRVARFAEPPGHVLRIFGIEFARLGDERLDRLARFGVDDLAEYLDRLRQHRRSIVLRVDRRLGLNSRGPETGQDKDHRRGAPDQESNDRCARIKHGQPSLGNLETFRRRRRSVADQTLEAGDRAGPNRPIVPSYTTPGVLASLEYYGPTTMYLAEILRKNHSQRDRCGVIYERRGLGRGGRDFRGRDGGSGLFSQPRQPYAGAWSTVSVIANEDCQASWCCVACSGDECS